MNKVWIGIDNGVSGSLGIINDNVSYLHVPIKKELSYTKKKQWINRIDGIKLYDILLPYVNSSPMAYLERPLVNPGMFKSTISAVRSLEATLIIVEKLGIPYQYVDSKEWQTVLLPSGLKGSDELKKASLQIGKRLFPQIDFDKFKDADGLLIAEWARRKFTK
jgi:hypothetical protein